MCNHISRPTARSGPSPEGVIPAAARSEEKEDCPCPSGQEPSSPHDALLVQYQILLHDAAYLGAERMPRRGASTTASDSLCDGTSSASGRSCGAVERQLVHPTELTAHASRTR